MTATEKTPRSEGAELQCTLVDSPAITLSLVAVLAFGLFASACGGDSNRAASSPEQSCRKSPGDDVEMGARTAVEGTKTGVKTGVEGVKAAGNATVGWFEGGSKESGKRWSEGKAETRRTAKEGAAEVDREASVPECP